MLAIVCNHRIVIAQQNLESKVGHGRFNDVRCSKLDRAGR